MLLYATLHTKTGTTNRSNSIENGRLDAQKQPGTIKIIGAAAFNYTYHS
jgi:hypothetical protein